ncbi:MAG TPA: cupin domain-containing protein [Candidatus Acidoferrales bacterium]|nr:cupin domain-containing protein [Candidatus Acidoferrales bacterium]
MAKRSPPKDRDRLEALNARVSAASLKGAWQREPSGESKDRVRPWVWRWNDILPNLLEAGELVPIDDVMKMRTIRLINPSLPVRSSTTKTFSVTIQHLGPGEITESHRHTSASLYFVIQGGRTYTTAEGEQQFMEPGDLLIQPSWTWHGSRNIGTEPTVWLTAMDTSLNEFLDAYFRDKYPEGDVQPVSKEDGHYKRRMGALRSRGALEGKGPFPVKYPWKETLELLEDLAAHRQSDPYDGVVLDYTDPLAGGPTTATLGCRIQMLRPGEETLSHRHTCNTVYHVARGSGLVKVGRSKADEETIQWGERDCFHVPSWHWHRFRNLSPGAPAILFSVSDRPLLESVRLYREEV